MCEEPAARPVDFALPFDVRCSTCGRLGACGSLFRAEKRVQSVCPASGAITWRFSMACRGQDDADKAATPCSALLELTSEPAVAERFVVAGGTQVAAAAAGRGRRRRRRRTVPGDEEDAGGWVPGVGRRSRSPPGDAVSASAGGLSREGVVAGERGRREREAQQLDALRRQRDWAAADVAATADRLQVRHVARWDDTPLRAEARTAVGGVRASRKASRAVREASVGKTRCRAARKGRGREGKPLEEQRAKVGRIDPKAYKSARAAVRKLHRSGALQHLLKAFNKS